ncbi:MAG: divTM7 [Candidatus Saccharibacteria bacterium]|nr:divTM7 [Candidatus Saccharibacteria bacterium]
MIESLKTSLAIWQTKTSDRTKLQHTYITVAGGLLIVAGIVGLLNPTLGQNILGVAILSAAMFLANAVVWSLLQSAVLSRISTRRPSVTRKK